MKNSEKMDVALIGVNSGLTKREHFAGLALQGLLANSSYAVGSKKSIMSRVCCQFADALLDELEK